jgi:hypothetical protein
MAGERFLTPFYEILRADRKATNLKHRLNHVLTQAAKGTGSFLVPNSASVNCYQGYHELSAVSELSAVTYHLFVEQAQQDFFRVRERLQARWPKNERPKWKVLVLPSGTGHQIMPPNWARAHLPEATYAFFVRDEYKNEFLSKGLRVVEFDRLGKPFDHSVSGRGGGGHRQLPLASASSLLPVPPSWHCLSNLRRE